MNIYKDSKGFPTVGIGHKFEKGEVIKNKYNEKDIDDLFTIDLNESKVIAKNVFPSLNNHPDKVQIILVSLSFNMGQGGIKKFSKFRNAIENKNYKVAANELKNSKWFCQVGNRAKDYVNILNNAK